MAHPIVAVVGLPGAGKSEAIKVFEDHGYTNIYIPAFLFEELDRLGKEHNEENERWYREKVRAEHGINAFEHLNIPKVKERSAEGSVTLESFYTWESYKEYKEVFGERFVVLAILASPQTRDERMAQRSYRALAPGQTAARTWAQIENLHQAGPIACADYFVVNEGSLEELREKVLRVLDQL